MNWHQYFIPDYEAGTLTWRIRDDMPTEMAGKTWNTRFSGKLAGWLSDRGYWTIGIGARKYRAHRVLWEMANGPIPDGLQIDHIDRNRSNNRLSNLRLATGSENHRNGNIPSNNKSGVRGVSYDKKLHKWYASIRHGGRTINLGIFASIEDAAACRQAAEAKYHGDFAPAR